MKGLAFDFAHLLVGGLVLISFMLLYQNRLYSLLNVFALQAVVLALSVAWQAYVQGAPLGRAVRLTAICGATLGVSLAMVF